MAAWKRYFLSANIPVLAATAHRLEELRKQEDTVDAGTLNDLFAQDPFMMMKIIAHVATNRRSRVTTDQETLLSSLVMMGISPFFRNFGPQVSVEEHLRDYPAALEGVQRLIKRAERAANFATGFAIHRVDTDVAVIRQAAFLHDFADLLMWCFAPSLAIEVRTMQRTNPTLRSANLQRFVFNIDLNDLRQELMKEWRFPELMVRISDARHTDHPIVRNVDLAVRLARHTEDGWDNAALPDDFADIANLLNATERVARGFVYKIDQALHLTDPGD